MVSISCGPCHSRGIETESSHWCVVCEEALCLTCRGHHLAMKMSKNHEILETSKMHKPITISEQFCSKHNRLPHDFFCFDHDTLACKDCLADTHRKCLNVMSVDSASYGAKKSQSFIDSTKLVKQILETIEEITRMRESNIKDIETNAEEIKKSVRMTKDKKVEKSLLQELDRQRIKIVSGLMKTTHEAKLLKEKIKEKRDIFEMIEKHGSDKQAFLLSHIIKHDLAETERHVISVVENATLFHIDYNDTNLQDTIKSIGSIKVKETSCKIKYAQIKNQQAQIPVLSYMCSLEYENYVNFEIIKGNFNIRGMTVNEKNELILCDYNGSRLLVVDENNQYKYQIDTYYKPWNIAVIPGTDIVVVTSFNSDYIQFIDIKRKKTVSQSTVKGSKIGGIAVSTEHVYVGAGGGFIDVLDHQGRYVRAINIKHTDRIPCYMTFSNTGYIYFTAGENVTCVKPDGKVVFTYKSPDQTKPWDIKTDNHDNVYVVYHNKGIHRLRSDGTFIDILKDIVLTSPVTLCFNRNFTKLFVSNGFSVICFKII